MLRLIYIRHRFGCYDEITEVDRRKVRHCNWVRFLRTSSTYSDQVNIIGTKIKGEPIYEVVKSIPANSELTVYYLPERPEEVFFMPAVHYLRNSLYRRTMDTILEVSGNDDDDEEGGADEETEEAVVDWI
ncbi:hypothetical protein O3M35_007165 [Rhynocoris fuscipes]|uniref:SET domain-containing protein n=1 Tax=Rhynocoris fuscipes TaxID=488301 RepID=A0AAW1DFI0_9HEMI